MNKKLIKCFSHAVLTFVFVCQSAFAQNGNGDTSDSSAASTSEKMNLLLSNLMSSRYDDTALAKLTVEMRGLNDSEISSFINEVDKKQDDLDSKITELQIKLKEKKYKDLDFYTSLRNISVAVTGITAVVYFGGLLVMKVADGESFRTLLTNRFFKPLGVATASIAAITTGLSLFVKNYFKETRKSRDLTEKEINELYDQLDKTRLFVASLRHIIHTAQLSQKVDMKVDMKVQTEEAKP